MEKWCALGARRALSPQKRSLWTQRMTELREMGTQSRDDAPPVPTGREVVERVTTSTGEWQLQRRDGHFEIICNGVFLMASYNRASDRALATLALGRISGTGLRVLVGGLGIGFTAQAVLEDRRVKRLEIVEIEPRIVVWHRTYFAGMTGSPLDDARTHLVQADVAHAPLAADAYDAILLDTDNGPGWLIRDANARLYSVDMSRHFLRALTPRGVVAYWSAERSAPLAGMLMGLGWVEEVEATDQIAPGCYGPAWIYLAGPSRRSGS